jgi:hypothetical protein
LAEVQENLYSISRATRSIRIEAAKRFKLKVREHNLKQFLPEKGTPEDHIDPKFNGHRMISFSDQIKDPTKFVSDPGTVIRTVWPHNELGISGCMLPRPVVFAIDRRWLEDPKLHPIIAESFKKRLKEEISKKPEDEINNKDRALFAKWSEYLYILDLKKRKPIMEIGRLLGAQVLYAEGVKKKDRVVLTHEEIDADKWTKRYGKNVRGRPDIRDILAEKGQIKDNIKKKLRAARKLVDRAGKGFFPCFNNKVAERQAEKTIKRVSSWGD